MQATHSKVTFSSLQRRRDGKPAKQETAEEFELHMRNIIAAVNAALPSYPEWEAVGGPIYSMDNASWHTAANLGLSEAQILCIPPRSYDIHKVIEHPFGPIKRTFKTRFSRMRSVRTPKQAEKLLRQIVKETVTAEAISADVATMRDTLVNIIQKGGDLADPPYR